jgi:BAHD acyltransferase
MAQEHIPQARPNGLYGQENASNANMIIVQQKCCVYPARPSDQRYCELTTFDLPYVTFFYNQKIILYPSPDQGFASAVESLKKSLSEALVHFYPLAGRLCLDEDGILKVDCNDAGVDFIEASSDVVGLSNLIDCDSSSKVMQYLVPYIDTLNVDGFFLPMVGVQVRYNASQICL